MQACDHLSSVLYICRGSSAVRRRMFFLLILVFCGGMYILVGLSVSRFFVTPGSLTNRLSTKRSCKCFILFSSHTVQPHACYSYHCIVTHIPHQTISRFEPRRNTVLLLFSIYFQSSHCSRMVAIDRGPDPVYNRRLALLRRNIVSPPRSYLRRST